MNGPHFIAVALLFLAVFFPSAILLAALFRRQSVPQLLIEVFGASYKTTVSGWITNIFGWSAIVCAMPGELDMLPASLYSFKPKIVSVCTVIALISKFYEAAKAKSKEVTGGTVQTPTPQNAPCIAKP